MAFGVKFVPLTPGVYPQSSPVSLTPEEDNSLSSLKQVDFEAYKRELIALRERDMAITKPTQLEYYARPRHRDVQIASPPIWPDDFDFDYDFGLLTQPFLDVDLSWNVSPTPAEFDAWVTAVADAPNSYDVDELIQSLYPDDLPSDFDSWDLYQENPKPCMSEIAEGLEDLMLVDDDAFLTPLEAEFNLDFSAPSPATPDAEVSSSNLNLTSSIVTFEF